jgi:1,4-dihydroxy-6-naphthoate synthase
LGHSPDADDAFMFWALAEGLVDTPLQFEHVLRDIQTLNEWAREGKLEFTALSVHNLAYVADRYVVLNQGEQLRRRLRTDAGRPRTLSRWSSCETTRLPCQAT